jgi:hypothetical protein
LFDFCISFFSTIKATNDILFLKRISKTPINMSAQQNLKMFLSYIHGCANYQPVESNTNAPILSPNIKVTKSKIIVRDGRTEYHEKFVPGCATINNIVGYNNDPNFDVDICDGAAHIFNIMIDKIILLKK